MHTYFYEKMITNKCFRKKTLIDTFQKTVKYLKENNISNNKKWLLSFYHFLSGFLKKVEFFTTLYQTLSMRLF